VDRLRTSAGWAKRVQYRNQLTVVEYRQNGEDYVSAYIQRKEQCQDGDSDWPSLMGIGTPLCDNVNRDSHVVCDNVNLHSHFVK
jgi:hypothetical protein